MSADTNSHGVLMMPGVSSQAIENFLSISYGLLEDNMKFCLEEMRKEFLYSDILKFFHFEEESNASIIVEVEAEVPQHQVEPVPLINIEIPEEDFMLKLKEDEMGDLTKIILGHTNIDEIKSEMKMKPTFGQSSGHQEKSGTCVCSICGKCFKKTYLSTHIREIHYHKEFSKYSCKECNVYFTRKEKYEGHLSKVHGAPKRYQCTICGKQFALNSDLFKHRAQVHITKPKLPCKHCGKLFKTGERLRRHELIHLALRPWECSLCGKKYPRKDKLKSHLKAKHPTIEDSILSTTLIK